MSKTKDLDAPDSPLRSSQHSAPPARLFGPTGERLTEAQRIFVEQYTQSGGKRSVAAKAAGISTAYAQYLIYSPKIQDAMHAYRDAVLRTEGGAVGLQVLMDLAKDADTPYVIRHRVGKDLLELAGHMKPQANQPLAADKPLMEMSVEELQAFINAGAGAVETLKNQRLRTIEGEVAPAQADSTVDRGSAQNSAHPSEDCDFFA